eukprot:m.277203 g.277203  ORF g.277203 m.277203 type:complete len:137 (+) comp86882_c0_seq1:152-562(+)
MVIFGQKYMLARWESMFMTQLHGGTARSEALADGHTGGRTSTRSTAACHGLHPHGFGHGPVLVCPSSVIFCPTEKYTGIKVVTKCRPLKPCHKKLREPQARRLVNLLLAIEFAINLALAATIKSTLFNLCLFMTPS